MRIFVKLELMRILQPAFCNWSYINYYFRDDFEEKFMEMVENLPKESKKTTLNGFFKKFGY